MRYYEVEFPAMFRQGVLEQIMPIKSLPVPLNNSNLYSVSSKSKIVICNSSSIKRSHMTSAIPDEGQHEVSASDHLKCTLTYELFHIKMKISNQFIAQAYSAFLIHTKI